jgi:hypothetical protein
MDFKEFKLAVQRQFNTMKKHDLFRVNLDKDKLWETYLGSFPPGTDPIYKERTEHNCNCCKSFIRSVGNMVAIINGELVSIWDVTIPGTDNAGYQVVSDAMSAYAKSCPISDVFLHLEPKVGVDSPFVILQDTVASWNHFFIQLPTEFVVRGVDIGPKLNEYRTGKDVMLRGLNEIKLDAVETVLELISQNSLYRGEEQKFALTEFKKLKKAFDKATNKDLFCWSNIKTVNPSVSRIRGTVIGTLLCDISEGYELDDAVKSFEAKVAPANYKRPTAVITKAMIEKAKETIAELGLSNSLQRRYAVLEDISINNILFADRTAKPRMNDVFDELMADTPKTAKNLDKVEEVSIDDFISKILPQANTIEVMVENHHVSNFVSLVAPVDMTAKTMFKWSNGFSWSYNGDVADSIKERVKKAGGKIEGDLCCRLAWNYTDDLDFHMKEPGNGHIYFSNRRTKSPCGGILDLDANGTDGVRSDPAENIYYSDKKTMKEGSYKLSVNNYTRRSGNNKDIGFDVEVEFDGNIHSFHYDKVIKTGEFVEVATIDYSKTKGFSITKSLPSSKSTKINWEIPTQSFQKVNVMMLSPNHWDGAGIGNKHYFFMLEGCKNDGTVRGFYNEFLNTELDKHRKVLEVVGSKMRTDETDDQLSGLGFSSTQRNSILVRVTGTFARIVKVNF